MARTRGAQAFSWSVAGGARKGRGTARRPQSCGSSSAATICDGVGVPAADGALVVMNAAEKQAAAASGGGAPAFVQEDAFLSILVDCFGQ